MILTVNSVVNGPFLAGSIVKGLRSGTSGTVVSHVGDQLNVTITLGGTSIAFVPGEDITSDKGGTRALVGWPVDDLSDPATADGTQSGATVGDTLDTAASLVVEDGTGLPTANSYISLADAAEYLATYRNPEVWLSASESERGQALRVATQWIDSKFGGSWIGRRHTQEQGLDWPRDFAYDQAGRLWTTMPVVLGRATAEMAVRYLQDPNSLAPDVSATEAGNITSQTNTIGPISQSITYQGASQQTEKVFQLVERMLRSAGVVMSGSFAVR